MSKHHSILLTRTSFFISGAGDEKRTGIQNKVFQVAILLWVTVIQKLYTYIW